RGFQILQDNAWQNSGRARIAGDVLMGVAGLASANPMLSIAGFSGLITNGVLAKYGGNEAQADPNTSFLRRITSPSEHPVDTNAFWNGSRSFLMAVGGTYAALARGDIGQGIGTATAGLIGVSFNTVLLTRRALARLGDRIPVRAPQTAGGANLTAKTDRDLPGADAEIAVGQSHHRVREMIGDGWNATKGMAKSILHRAPAIAGVVAYTGLVAWAASGVAAVTAGSPVIGGLILGSAAMQGLGVAFKMITPAIKTELDEAKASVSHQRGHALDNRVDTTAGGELGEGTGKVAGQPARLPLSRIRRLMTTTSSHALIAGAPQALGRSPALPSYGKA
ncbi:MAG: hypothetical protein AAF213_06875, partial [Pseudomonadota bacterium]